jgi:hypothetical protein
MRTNGGIQQKINNSQNPITDIQKKKKSIEEFLKKNNVNDEVD